jgi:hypothetical protein
MLWKREKSLASAMNLAPTGNKYNSEFNEKKN